LCLIALFLVKFCSLFRENEYDAGGTISYHAGGF
jgi:hypothetical protein